MNKEINNRIFFLDILRVFAFTSVLVGHKFYSYLINYMNEETTHTTVRFLIGILNPFFAYGGAGVVVFFLVSGYIISMVINIEKTQVFLIKRFFRVYPLFILAIVIELTLNLIFKNQNLPTISNFLIQISLMGDFFNYPLALKSVEWTLRIEVIFYFLYALLKSINLIKHKNSTIILFLLITIALYKLGPFVNNTNFSRGYITLYMPFLFIGSIVYYIEKNWCNKWLAYFIISVIFIMYYKNIYKINATTIESHFVFYGTFLFYLFFKLKDKLIINKTIIFFSGLTYSVYLFHNWLWSYIYDFIARYVYNIININLITLFLLMLFCYFVNVTFEKYFIKIGHRISKKYI